MQNDIKPPPKLKTSKETLRFDVESMKNVIKMIHQNAWVAAVDTKYAFFITPFLRLLEIAHAHKRYTISVHLIYILLINIWSSPVDNQPN